MRDAPDDSPDGVAEGEGASGWKERVPAVVKQREAWERGFAAWDAGSGGAVASLRAAAGAAGVSENVARGWVETGDAALGLPSWRERVRDAAREVVARDRSGTTLEAVERRGVDAMARDRAKALADARKREAVLLGDAVQQRAEEAKLVRGVRQTATALLSAEGHLLRATMRLAKSLDDDMNTDEKLGALKMKPRERVALIKDIASIVKNTAETARLAVILGTDAATDDMTIEEAEAYVALATRAMARRIRARTVVEAQVDTGLEALLEDVAE